MGLFACGDAVATDTGATTGSVDPSTSLPTTGNEPTTAGTPDDTGTTTGDGSSGGSTFASTSSSESGVETSSSSGTESTSADAGTTADETTSGGLCVSDTSADPAPWSVSRGIPDESLTAWWLGGGASSIVYMLMWEGVLDLGGGPVDTGVGSHVHIASHSPSGEFQWAEHIGGTSNQISKWKAASDCAGNIVVAGQFWGDISTQGVHLVASPGLEYDEGNPFPTVDWFVMKFAPDGALLWAERFGDDRSQRLHGLTLLSDGTIVVSGTVLGTLELGGEPIVAGEIVRKAALAAFTPDGAFVWQRSFESTVGVDLPVIDAGGDDRISVIAQVSAPVDLGGGVLPDDGEPELVAQYAADGGHLWSQRWQLATHKLRGVQTDAAGGAVYSGLTTVNEAFTEFIMRHDDEGAFAWVRAYELEPDMDELVNIEGVLAGDEIVVLGGFIGSVDVGGGVFDSPPPLRSLFLARYDLAGQHLASEMHAASDGVYPSSLAYGPDHELVLGGAFTGTLDLGGGPLQSLGDRDLFVHRFAP